MYSVIRIELEHTDLSVSRSYIGIARREWELERVTTAETQDPLIICGICSPNDLTCVV